VCRRPGPLHGRFVVFSNAPGEGGERSESGGKRKAGPRTSTQREAGLRRGDPKQRECEVPKKKGWGAGLKNMVIERGCE
jgi:hypothetical protein